MIFKSRKFWKNFFEFVLYSLVGLGTTIVSYGIRWIILYFFSQIYQLDLQSTNAAMVGGSSILRSVAHTAGWIAGVLFAFFPNKVLVFRNRIWTGKQLFRQFRLFVLSRVGTYFLELVLAVVLPIILQGMGYRSDYPILRADNLTIFISIISVTAINYLVGKWIVFSQKGEAVQNLASAPIMERETTFYRDQNNNDNDQT